MTIYKPAFDRAEVILLFVSRYARGRAHSAIKLNSLKDTFNNIAFQLAPETMENGSELNLSSSEVFHLMQASLNRGILMVNALQFLKTFIAHAEKLSKK